MYEISKTDYKTGRLKERWKRIMRYHELSEEEKKKYGPELFAIVERRIKLNIGADKIEDYLLVELDRDGSKGWIYYPDIDW